MSSFGRCSICKKYDSLDIHKCAPVYFYKHEDWSDDKFQEIRGYNFEDAAIEFGKLYNGNGDYNLMDNPQEVIISDGKTEKKFTVSAEPDIHYSATEVEKK